MEPNLIQSWLIAWALTAPRILITFALLPILTDSMIPANLRNGIILIFSLFVLPLTHEQFLLLDTSLINLIGIVIKEGVLGLLIGFILSTPFWAIKATGFLIDMQRGVMSALFFSHMTENMVSPIGNFFNLLLTVLLLMTGSFMTLLKTVFLSYQTWPINQMLPTMSLKVADYMLQQFDELIYTTLLLAGPIIIMMFLIDVGLGLVGRILPQLNIFMLAMPVKSAVAFLMLIYYVTFIATYMKDNFFKMEVSLTLLQRLLQ